MARDALGIASEEAHQRAEQGAPAQTGEGVDAAANSARSHSIANSATNGGTHNSPRRPPFKPDSWIPVEEHALGKPQRKVKVISIGCGFSGA
jgi:hypothetical protein